MLSILIPVYNQDVTALANKLYDQCTAIITGENNQNLHLKGLPVTFFNFEIIVLDDGSADKIKKVNRSLTNIPHIVYEELNKNIGRSAIRNKLAQMASYEFLLFLDGDSGIKNKDFIQKYIENEGTVDVLSGGRVYPEKSEIDPSHNLHYSYGIKYESLTAAERNKDPYLNLHSNNFLIRKSIFDKILFDESLQSYGYEDVLFGEKLRQLKAKVSHVDNPVIHLDLETNKDFLGKTLISLRNLYHLQSQGKITTTRLLKFVNNWKYFAALILLIERIFDNQINTNLHSANANVRLFQFWKLCRWLEIKKKGG